MGNDRNGHIRGSSNFPRRPTRGRRVRHQGIVLGGAWLNRYSLYHNAVIVGPAIYIEGLTGRR